MSSILTSTNDVSTTRVWQAATQGSVQVTTTNTNSADSAHSQAKAEFADRLSALSANQNPVLPPPKTMTQEEIKSTLYELDDFVTALNQGFSIPVSDSTVEIFLEMVRALQSNRNSANTVAKQNVQISYDIGVNEKDISYDAAADAFKGAWAGALTSATVDAAGFAAQFAAGKNEVATEKESINLGAHTEQAKHLKKNIDTAQTALNNAPGNQEKIASFEAAQNAYKGYVHEYGPGANAGSAVRNLTDGNVDNVADLSTTDIHEAYLQDTAAAKHTLASDGQKHKALNIGAQTAGHSTSRIAGDSTKGVYEKSSSEKHAEATMKRTLRDLMSSIAQSQGKERDDANNDVQRIIEAIKSWLEKLNSTNQATISKI